MIAATLHGIQSAVLHPPALVSPLVEGVCIDPAAYWASLLAPVVLGPSLPYAIADDWPYTCALLAQDPATSALKMDPKQLRTTEHSMRLCIAAAQAAAQEPWLGVPPLPDRTGLYLGLPSIEDAAPGWDVLEEFSASGEGVERISHYAHHPMHPMIGLIRLNSSLSAHLSICLRLSGANAAFSPFADAGLQALIEGALSIAEGENDALMVGGTAMHINETLAVQWKALELSRFQVLPGEGAAMLKMERHSGPAPGLLRIQGYGRCFRAQDPASAWVQAVGLAAEMAGHAPDWVISDLAAPQPLALPHVALAEKLGWLGGAHGATALALAAHGLNHQCCLSRPLGALDWAALPACLQRVAIAGCSPHGQATAIIVARATEEAPC